jgi:hypothetical protein
MEITDHLMTGRYYEVSRSQEAYTKGSQLFDYFDFDWRNRRVHTNTLDAN